MAGERSLDPNEVISIYQTLKDPPIAEVVTQRIRTLIVDDHPLVRRALFDVLGGADFVKVVGEASNGNEATEISKAVKPDVVLMDLHMPQCDGVEATERLQSELPETKVLMLTVSEKEKDLFAAIKAGARGYMLKNEEPEMILQAIQYVARGGIIVSPEMAAHLSKELGEDGPQATDPALSCREEQILELLAHGADDAKLAKTLNFRETWIRFLLSNIMQKLGLDDRSDVVTYATRYDLVNRDQVGGPEAPSGDVENEPVSERDQTEGDGVVLAQERRDSDNGPVDPPVEVEPQSVMGMVELVISPPLEPIQLLKLHKWLGDVVDGRLMEVHPSWGSDTVLEIDIRRLSPLVRLLEEMPLVAEVTEEPYEEEEHENEVQVGEEEQHQEVQAEQAEEQAPKRFRLVLNPI